MFGIAGTDAGVALLAELIGTLAELEQGVADSVRIDRIALLERAKSAVAAAQAVETAAFADSQRAEQVALGVPADRASRGIASQVALARHVSPFEAGRYVGWARILTSELPATFALLRAGQTSEWRAMIVARETAWLSREHRAAVDLELAPQLPELGNRRVEAAAKTIAYRLDPEGYVNRLRGAENGRRVSLRPAPDTMSYLGALLPVAQGVACYASLTKRADTLRSAGDERTRGQIMADTLVERVTGQAAADEVPVEVNLVMTDETLFDHGDEPGQLVGYGPIPATTARDLALGKTDGSSASGAGSVSGAGAVGDVRAELPRWLRRLYTTPDGHQLIAMESHRRCFTPAQRQFITLRDHTCRTPWCDAPIRHIDHITPHGDGGATRVDNGQGLCQACNHARQAPGWRVATVHDIGDGRGGGIAVVLTTPTGHRYRSRPPDPPARQQTRPTGERANLSPIEAALARLLAAA